MSATSQQGHVIGPGHVTSRVRDRIRDRESDQNAESEGITEWGLQVDLRFERVGLPGVLEVQAYKWTCVLSKSVYLVDFLECPKCGVGTDH